MGTRVINFAFYFTDISNIFWPENHICDGSVDIVGVIIK